MNRLGILFFYDKSGIIDEYIECLLKNLTPAFDRLLTVVNGELSSQEKLKLEKFGDVLERPNEGFDIWAYKSGLEHFGWKKLNDFDEIILFNNTIMGPVESFDSTFGKMDAQQDLDFWGLTTHFGEKSFDWTGKCKYGYIPEHIQSHFIAVRKSMFSSQKFHDYWDKMPMIHSYEESVGLHEAYFTKYFADLGFKWGTSVNMENYHQLTNYPLLAFPKQMISEEHCPIFKKRSFFDAKDGASFISGGEIVSDLYQYLRDETPYDEEMIWPPLLRNYEQSDVYHNLNLNYCLSINSTENLDLLKVKQGKYCVVFETQISVDLTQISKDFEVFPESFDLFILGDKIEEKEIKNALLRFKFNRIDCKAREQKLQLFGELQDYHLVLWIGAKSKRGDNITKNGMSEYFFHKLIENAFPTQNFMTNIIHTFDMNPACGLLSPFPAGQDYFRSSENQLWNKSFESVESSLQVLKLSVPISREKQPIIPTGNVFWFRPQALQKISYLSKINEDTLLCLYPLIAQAAGYYSGRIISEKWASIELTTQNYYLSQSMPVYIDSDDYTEKPYLLKILWCVIGSQRYDRLANFLSKKTKLRRGKLNRLKE